ncbi:YggS family pyridoxal phosphate-dependent enzyme [Chryseobacterium hagamense]|uniref:Pyridoxal phosphate homeostasis protein n=1 Tax=Chryseobacterium hagamense TaxID=395935 RepID=A0A511YHB9_9FLAO|nr:YggS family pyridoxal phosphate-dependent enzyme [Chryseobacterium hagamense]GEN74604.1 YggS family pyridoxal phosphate enzyme [Chryseobacterium hagamense]
MNINLKTTKFAAMSIQENYNAIKSQLPYGVELVAVSKTHPVSAIQEVYGLGQRVFGENKVQEVTEKYPLLPKDIRWHLIGHLQTNKVKYIAGFIDTIQSVDSEKLIREINKEAAKNNRTINVLLQVKIAEEESKSGLEISEARELFEQYLNGEFKNICITGLMGMATFTEDQDQIREEFLTLKKLFDELNQLKKLETLSMGMSDDFPMAIECGANSIRIGSAIFGRRDYSQ